MIYISFSTNYTSGNRMVVLKICLDFSPKWCYPAITSMVCRQWNKAFWLPLQVLADMIITNESRIHKSYVVANFRKPRQYAASISVRHQDMKAVGAITADMQKWMRESSGIDQGLPCFVGLASLDNQACNLTVLVTPFYQIVWASDEGCSGLQQRQFSTFPYYRAGSLQFSPHTNWEGL